MKILLVCTSGGHFATMKGLRDFWQSHERVWVTHEGADTQILEKWGEKVHWLPYQAPRNALHLANNLGKTLHILRQESPDLVISTGASIAVNFGYISKLMGKRLAFVESVSRAHRLSMSGRMIYPICDEFYVQWPELAKRYNKAVFRGYAS
jgi:beta-1,4-N-acetylglucosaminyltransferase